MNFRTNKTFRFKNFRRRHALKFILKPINIPLCYFRLWRTLTVIKEIIIVVFLSTTLFLLLLVVLRPLISHKDPQLNEKCKGKVQYTSSVYNKGNEWSWGRPARYHSQQKRGWTWAFSSRYWMRPSWLYKLDALPTIQPLGKPTLLDPEALTAHTWCPLQL